ncbi:MAG: hypothetical protein FJ217_07055 [Ignavibacteria bacterium]|nr:hypothetical protein [Ignavibacteria bacterium]
MTKKWRWHHATITSPARGKGNYRVEKLHTHSGARVAWHCKGRNDFVIWFPKKRNPLARINEVNSINGSATARVKSFALSREKKKHFCYCALVWVGKGKQRRARLVVGNSPPEMIVE